MFNWVVDKAWCFSAYKSVNGGFKLQVLKISIVSLLLLLLLLLLPVQFVQFVHARPVSSWTCAKLQDPNPIHFNLLLGEIELGFVFGLILCYVCVNISDAEVFIEEHSDVSYFVCVFVCLGLLFQRRPAYHFHYRFPHGEFTSREIIQITLWK